MDTQIDGTTVSKSTPTPWIRRLLRDDESLEEIYGADGELVLGEASGWGFNQKADEDFAFRAANSHDALVKALQAVQRDEKDFRCSSAETLALVDAALANAGAAS